MHDAVCSTTLMKIALFYLAVISRTDCVLKYLDMVFRTCGVFSHQHITYTIEVRLICSRTFGSLNVILRTGVKFSHSEMTYRINGLLTFSRIYDALTSLDKFSKTSGVFTIGLR